MPSWGYLQMAVLLAAWAHPCLGLTFLFRLWRWFASLHSPLLVLAVLIPLLALMGYEAGAREVVRDLATPGFRQLNVPLSVTDKTAQKLPPPVPHERAVLRGIGADPALARLACQLRPRTDLSVAPLIPPEAGAFVLGRAPRIPGDERFLAVLFVNMRGSTHLTERHMPFDSVFLLGRYIAAITRATLESGGRPVQFLGDGLLALFGIETDPATACRQALVCITARDSALLELGPLFGQETGEVLRYGVGLHCGRAIVGEIGFGGHVAFTALGETVNLAHGLQEFARDTAAAAAAAISNGVFTVAGVVPEWLPEMAARLRGRHKPLSVRLVHPGPEEKNRKKKVFFFEKKKQKTLVCCRGPLTRAVDYVSLRAVPMQSSSIQGLAMTAALTEVSSQVFCNTLQKRYAPIAVTIGFSTVTC